MRYGIGYTIQVLNAKKVIIERYSKEGVLAREGLLITERRSYIEMDTLPMRLAYYNNWFS